MVFLAAKRVKVVCQASQNRLVRRGQVRALLARAGNAAPRVSALSAFASGAARSAKSTAAT